MFNFLNKIDFEKNTIRKSLLILFFATLPNSVAINNIVFFLIIFYWILFENKKEIIKLIKINPFVFFIYLFVGILFISLLWTSNIKWGIHILSKELILLSIPIFMNLIRKKDENILIKTYIIAMTASEIISYSVKLQIIHPVFNATVYDPTPFMSHISYTPFLAFTIYLLIYFLFTSKETFLIKTLSIFFITTMSINLFITGGRAGQIAFFILLILAVFQFLKFNLKSLLIVFFVIPAIFITAYTTSKIFHNRVNLAINNITHFQKHKNSSVGLRIQFAKNTLQMIKENPILGVGIGDFPKEYKKINKKYSPNLRTTVQPHDMYIFVWAQSGIFAFFSFIMIFVIQLIAALKIKDEYKPIRMAFPLFFITIMFSDSYLLGHFTTHLFIAFSSILYKDITWKLIKS